jgi:2-iminobutanoate/2-iminopropanoate deaminase
MTEPAGEILLTVVLKHDQSQNLDQLQTKLAMRRWWDRFPPEGVSIDSWYVVMGIGQIVTLRLPPDKLAAVNVEIERSAWGVFTTEFYPAYDFVPVRERITARYRAGEWGDPALQEPRR